MSKVEAVVFDIGRVLIHWDPEGFFDRQIGKPRRKELFAAVDLHGMNDTIDMGRDIADAVGELAAQNPKYADDILLWHSHWLDMVDSDIPETAAILRALRAAGVPVFALSNFGIQTLEIAEKAFPVLKEFDQRFISGHLKVIKPDARIYEILEQETGIFPEGLLFIDDKPENIAAAKARGWQGHLFDSPEGLISALKGFGLPTP
jgi:2-haloacid dehalogenase